jgi:hypothetical protein
MMNSIDEHEQSTVGDEELSESNTSGSDAENENGGGDEVTRGQVQASTSHQYAGQLAMMARFLKDIYPEAVEGDPPSVIPSRLTRDMLKTYLHAYSKFPLKENETSQRFKSVGAVKNALNAIVSLWKLRDRPMPEELHRFTVSYRKYYTRVHAQAVKKGHANPESGSAEISFDGYCAIAHRLSRLRGCWSAPLFWTSLWNLVCRGVSVAGLSTAVMRWKDDSLRVRLLATKNDPTSEKVYEKNVYCNLQRNEICMILWLAVEIFSKTSRKFSGDDETLGVLLIFKGENPEDIFTKHLRKALSNETVDGLEPLDEAILGAVRDNIGTHTPRKSTGPEADKYECVQCGKAFDIRGGWGLGKVKDRYNSKPGDGADKILGRILAGLDPNEDSFASLPPRFTPEGLVLLTEEFWIETVPGYEHMTPGFRTALPFLLARLIVGFDWLKENLPKIEHNEPTHPLWLAPILLHIERLKPFVICKAGYDYSDGKLSCSITKLRVTGVPSFVVTSIRLRRLEERLQEIDNRISTTMANMRAEIVQVIETIPSITGREVWNMICNRLEGASIRITPTDIEQIIDARFERFEELLEQLRPQHTETSTQPVVVGPLVPQFTAETRLFLWGGKNHRTPEDFVFPHGADVTLKSVWDMWFFGCIQGENSIGPFRHFEDRKDLRSQLDRQYLTRARSVVQKLIAEGLKLGISIQQMNTADRVESTHIYCRCFESLKAHVYTKSLEINPSKPVDLKPSHSFLYEYRMLKKVLK